MSSQSRKGKFRFRRVNVQENQVVDQNAGQNAGQATGGPINNVVQNNSIGNNNNFQGSQETKISRTTSSAISEGPSSTIGEGPSSAISEGPSSAIGEGPGKVHSRSVSKGPSKGPNKGPNKGPSKGIRKSISKVSSGDQSYNNSYSADDYGTTDLRSHIYDKPDTYAGGAVPRERKALTLYCKKYVQVATNDNSVNDADANDADVSDVSDTDANDENGNWILEEVDLSIPSNSSNHSYEFKIKTERIMVPDAVEQPHLELLTNAADNAGKSVKGGVNPKHITVNMDRQWISIRNHGMLIPIEIHNKTGMYVPNVIFGVLLSSSNYGKGKSNTGAGRNGYGAKITNIFSKEFIVEIGDPERGLHYKQIWRNNMLECEDPVITEYHGEGYIEVSYLLDHDRFTYEEYPDEAFKIFACHCLNVSFIYEIPVFFNGYKFQVKDIDEYIRYNFGSNANYLVHRQWPDGTAVAKRKGKLVAKDASLPMIQIALVDTPNVNHVLAFSNGLFNRNGGIHVEKTYDAIKKPILDRINDHIEKQYKDNTKKGKSKSNEKGAIKIPKLTIKHLKNHISMIVSWIVPNPTWDGQAKRCFNGSIDPNDPRKVLPPPDTKIPDKWYDPINKWELWDKMVDEMLASLERKLKTTDGKKGRQNAVKGKHANWAGKSVEKSKQCTLVLTEGESAMTYAENFFSKIPGFNNIYGFFPLKGKVLNVRGKNPIAIANNNECTNIKKMMGFRLGVDYNLKENCDTLSYHNIMILTDPDVDGEHIKGLFINYLDVRYPGILENLNVSYLRLPIVRVEHHGIREKFYTMAEFTEWVAKTPDHMNKNTYYYRYFKGLGTSNEEDVEEDFKAQYFVRLIYDPHSPQNIDLLFNKKYAEARKRLVVKYKPNVIKEHYVQEPISNLMRDGVLSYSVANVLRSIPGMDGFKDSHRKLVYAAFDIWGAGITASKAVLKRKHLKVAQFTPRAATITLYEHGEKSLDGALVGMAQRFPGANNLPLFVDDGQFGSRRILGKDASSSRYIFTYPEIWMALVIRREDEIILTQRVDEGENVEFTTYSPILPLALLNGAFGVATGFATKIPKFNPVDILMVIAKMLRGLTTDYLKEIIRPWYRGFNGPPIEITIGKKKTEKPKNENLPAALAEDHYVNEDTGEVVHLDEDDEDFGKNAIRWKPNVPMVRAVVRGKFELIDQHTARITEIPIGRAIDVYRNWLEHLCKEGVFKEIEKHSEPNRPDFIVRKHKNSEFSFSNEVLKLTKTIPMNNMILLDEKGTPQYFETIFDIIENFYQRRFYHYELRKSKVIPVKQAEIDRITYKIICIEAQLDGRLEVRGQTKEQVQIQLNQLGIPYDCLANINITNLIQGGTDKMKAERVKLIEKLEAYKKLTPVELWESDLTDFTKAYFKEYPDEIHRLTDNELHKTFLAPWATKANPRQAPKYFVTQGDLGEASNIPAAAEPAKKAKTKVKAKSTSNSKSKRKKSPNSVVIKSSPDAMASRRTVRRMKIVRNNT